MTRLVKNSSRPDPAASAADQPEWNGWGGFENLQVTNPSAAFILGFLTLFTSHFLLSINSEDGERGVTFRVGKFIGQVSIESG